MHPVWNIGSQLPNLCCHSDYLINIYIIYKYLLYKIKYHIVKVKSAYYDNSSYVS